MRIVATTLIAALAAAPVADAQIPSLESLRIEPKLSKALNADRQVTAVPGRRPFAPSSPRFNQRPALTGYGGLTLERFRNSILANGDPYFVNRTAEDVTMKAQDLGADFGGFASESTFLMMGWSQLWMNWAYATILGDQTKAAEFFAEALELELQNENLLEAESPFGTVSRAEKDQISAFLSVMLRIVAHDVGSEAVLMPDTVDPEGYIRQRLGFVRDELNSFAQAVRDLRHW